MNIGEEIRKHRKEQGLTQEQLSEKSGVSRVLIAEWETGKKEPRLLSIMKVLLALNLKLTVEKRDTSSVVRAAVS